VRVTQQMMISRSASNLSSALERVLDLQNQLSSGKRLARPSDDPTGIPRALSYRTSIAALRQYKDNCTRAESQLATVEQTLNSVNTLLVRARELATSMANDDFDATARAGAATEARDIFDQLIQLGNTQNEGRYIFSGHETRTASFLATATGVTYQGDQGILYSQIETSSQMAVNLIGSDMLLAPVVTLGAGFDCDRGVDSAVLLADLLMGSGIDINPGTDLNILDENTGTIVAVDLSGAVTVGDVVTAINTQLAAGGMLGVTAAVSPSGDAIRLTAENDGTVTSLTKLANLNNGAGIDLSPGSFRVATDDGTVDVTIDVSGLTTVGDLMAAFDAQMDAAAVSLGIPELANVSMDLNAGQTGLRIIDGNALPLGLRVEDLLQEATAAGLGLVGYVNDELVGTDLNPVREITISEGGAGQTTAADLGVLGSFTGTLDGADLDPILTLTTPISELNHGTGLTLGSIRIAQGTLSTVVNLAGAVTIGDVIDRINACGLQITAAINSDQRGIQVVPTVTTESLTITDEDSAGGALALGIAGSSDVMGGMLLLIDALESNDRETVARLLGTLEKATDSVLDRRAAVGTRVRRLQSTGDRLSDMQLLMTGLLSDVEDADIVEVTTQLATQQNIYQAALNAVARSLTPSLADFLG